MNKPTEREEVEAILTFTRGKEGEFSLYVDRERTEEILALVATKQREAVDGLMECIEDSIGQNYIRVARPNASDDTFLLSDLSAGFLATLNQLTEGKND